MWLVLYVDTECCPATGQDVVRVAGSFSKRRTGAERKPPRESSTGHEFNETLDLVLGIEVVNRCPRELVDAAGLEVEAC